MSASSGFVSFEMRMHQLVETFNNIPVPAFTVLLYAVSWIPFIPLIVANYGGMRGLPSQLAFAFVLHLPTFIFSALGLWSTTTKMLIPYALVILFDAFVIRDYFKWTGSTSALGLFVLPPGEVVLLGIGAATAYFVF